MLKCLMQRNPNRQSYYSLLPIIKTSIHYHSALYFCSKTDVNTNQSTLDYATLFKYVRPEMVHRIQQVMDHETYLHSLSQQIQAKKTYHENLEKQQQYKEPQIHNQKVSKQVIGSLQQNINEEEESMYEPGLDLNELSSIKQFESTFYGATPLHSFQDFNIDKHLIKAINDIGITLPSHIQQLSIPQILSGKHCVIGSETGTGKTIAFLLPILHQILNDKTITQAAFDPISKFTEYYLSKENERKQHHKYHPFEFDAEKKYPCVVIIEPNEHLCVQVQKVINEILDRYYDNIYVENRNNPNFYKLKTMSLHGRALLPKSNALMPDILISTPTALLTNLHKKHNENRYRGFLSKIRYMVLDEADFLTRSTSRFQLRYIFSKLKELQRQITNNPLKYKLLIPKYIRDENMAASASIIYKELNRIGKPQVIFVGATIPTQGGRNVAETIREWLDKAVWVRTPGLHNISSHIAQEFRFVPRTMELDILHQVLIGLARDHLYDIMFQTDDDILYEKEKDINDINDTINYKESGKHWKRKRRVKKAKNKDMIAWENKQKQLHILIFVNTKKFTRECYKYLLTNGWFNTRCIHSQLHREERKQRLNDFENGITQSNNELTENIMKKNIAINEEINEEIKEDSFEYKQLSNNIHILVTSDFANRGVDFQNVDVIINCQFPNHAIDYLHRAGRTGRGGIQNRNKNNHGRVISFFNEYDLDLAWHIQMSLINQYKNILSSNETNNDNISENIDRIGTNSVELDDCFGIEQESIGEILRSNKGIKGNYQRMSLPRDYQKTIDLTRIDIDDMDEKLLNHILKHANKNKWINNENNNDNEKQEKISDKQQLQQLIDDRKEKKWKLKVPWPYRLEFTTQ